MAKKIQFSREELKAWFSGETKGSYIKEAQEFAEKIRVHADGLYPEKLIAARRPHEPAEVQEYRKTIWEPKTEPTINKVFTSLSKIRRSSDWAVNYPQDEFTRIPEGERLEDYAERNFPYFTSVTNWVFSMLLREYLIDPNAVMLVYPLDIPEDPTAFFKPYPTVFSSANVIEYREENYCILINPLGSTYVDKGVTYKGKSFYVVSTEQVLRYDQKNNKGEYRLGIQNNHGLGFMPAYQLKAVLFSSFEDSFLYKSRLCGMIPGLNEAAREYSDLQAAKVMSIYPERWEFTSNECKECNGTGKTMPTPTAPESSCNKCEGKGWVPNGPYSKMLIGRGALDMAAGQPLPIPPAGYVEKDVETVKVQDAGVDKHLYSALASINMQFLDNTPLAQSGIAKEVDRDETTNFVHGVAEDIVRIMDWLYRCIAKWRYSVQYPNEEDIKAMLPNIPVPEHFDIFSTRFIEEDMKTAKENKLNPVIIGAMELNYASKKFNSDSEVRDGLMLVLELDPFANVSEDDKQLRLQNDGIRKLDYIISSNIGAFIKRAILENEDFPVMEYEKQKKILEGYGQEVMDANDNATKLKVVPMDTGLDKNGQPINDQQQPPIAVNQ